MHQRGISNWLSRVILIVSVVGLSPLTFAQDQDQGAARDARLEEITVTGTRIRNKSYNDVGSPVDVIDSESILADAPTGKVSSFLQFVPQNVGDFDSSFADAITPGKWGGASADLRGLGPGSTLILLNGRRQTRFAGAVDGLVDINTLVPSIAVDRVEVLNDGASSIYGTDAVGGVVNFITRDDFSGVEIRGDARGTAGFTKDTFSHNNQSIGILFGAGNEDDSVHVTGAFEYFRQDGLTATDLDIPESIFLNPAFASSFGQPGSIHIPTRDAAGELVLTGASAPRSPDPDCQRVEDEGITADPDYPAPSFVDGTFCRLKISQVAPLLANEERWVGRAGVTWDVSDNITFKGAFGAAQTFAGLTGMPALPGLTPFPTVFGEHPANVFGAVDANGAPLFAQDANGDGIPDRDPVTNVVLLAPVPQTQSAGTIPFNEDVQLRQRAASTTTLGVFRDDNQNRTIRAEAGLTGTYDRFTWDFGWVYAAQELQNVRQDADRTRLQAALNGFGGDTGDKFYNPFGSSLFVQPGDPLFNDPDVIDRILISVSDVYDSTLWSLDGSISGDLFELPGGMVAGAIGFQYREESIGQNFDNARNTGQTTFNPAESVDFEGDVETWSVFFEGAIPVFRNGDSGLDLSIAGRYERDDDGLDSFNPKVSLIYGNDLVNLKGSWSTSFLRPSLPQSDGITQLPIVVDDTLGSGITAQVSTRIIGSAGLEPQESTSISFGIDIVPADNWKIGLNYWRFEFEDLLRAPTAQSIVNSDPFGPLISRNAAGEITLILRPFFNASSVETDGIDIYADYDWDTTRGQFSLKADATYVTTYDIQEVVGGPVVDGVGFQNRNNIGRPQPELRAVVSLDWASNNHAARLAARYASEITSVRSATNIDVTEDPVTFDASYTRSFDKIAGLRTTIGVINLFGEEPNILSSNGADFFIRNTQPFRGRIVHASFLMSF